MHILVRMSHSLIALSICVVAGWVVGYFWPTVGEAAYVIAQLYLAVVSMAAIPLLVVATFFGLRQVLQLPHPGKRVVMIASLAVALVYASAVSGVIGAIWLAPGSELGSEARQHLGSLVQQQGGEAEIRLWAADQVMLPEPSMWTAVVPDNVFRVLAEGRSLGILLVAIFFGMAFAALPKEQTQGLNRLFEASYRALELIIQYANTMLPVVAFGMSAHVLANTNMASIVSMGSFLFYFFCIVTLLCIACVITISLQNKLSVLQVLNSLKAPLLVSLVSSSSTASIPHSIEALSTRLGLSRGIVELVIPISAVFLRTGSAIYYVLLTAFVANLYGRPLDAGEWMLVSLSATAAAFASAGTNGLANVAFATLTLSMLQLPIEAAMALFIAIDFLCEGLRNLLSLLAACVLVSWVAAGLPSEKQLVATPDRAINTPLQLVLTRGSALLLVAGSCMVAIFIVLAGIGVGVRNANQFLGAAHHERMFSGAPR